MGEGRYRTLLCLIQLAVPDWDPADPRADRARRPARRGPRRRAAGGVLADPARSGGRARRAPGHRARAPALCRPRCATCSTRRSRPASRGCRAQSSYDTLLARAARRAGRQERELHALGRTPALARAARLRARGRRAPARAGGGAGAPPDRARAAGVGARGVRAAAGAPATSATSRRVFARLPRVRGLSATSQTIARELVRWRERHAPPPQDRPVQSVLSDAALVEIAKRKPTSTERARADPRRQRGQPAPAGDRAARRCAGAGANDTADAAAGGRSARRRRTPTTRR